MTLYFSNQTTGTHHLRISQMPTSSRNVKFTNTLKVRSQLNQNALLVILLQMLSCDSIILKFQPDEVMLYLMPCNKQSSDPTVYLKHK